MDQYLFANGLESLERLLALKFLIFYLQTFVFDVYIYRSDINNLRIVKADIL